MKVIWFAEMKVSGVEGPKEAGDGPVLKLGLKGRANPEMLGNVGMMMQAPFVRVTIEEVQGRLDVDPETGEILG